MARILLIVWLIGNAPGIWGADHRLSEGQGKVNLSPYSYALETLKDLNPQDVLLMGGKFKAQNITYHRAPQDEQVWLRFTLHNPTDKLLTRVFELAFPVLDYIHMYQVVDGKLKKVGEGGILVAFDQRPLPYKNFAKNIVLKAQESATFYVHVKSRSAMNLQMNLWEPDYFHQRKGFGALFHAACYGFALAMIIYNLILFIAVRETDYLYFSLFTLATAMVAFVSDGLALQFLYPGIPGLNDWVRNGSILGIAIFTFLFIQSFYQVNNIKQSIRYSKPIVIIGLGGLVVSALISMEVFILVACLYAVPLCIGGALASYFALKSGRYMAGFFTTGWFLFAIGFITAILDYFALVPPIEGLRYSYQVGVVVITIFLSLALGAKFYRFNQFALNQKALLREKKMKEDEAQVMSESLISMDESIPYQVSIRQADDDILRGLWCSSFFLKDEHLSFFFFGKVDADAVTGPLFNGFVAGAAKAAIHAFDWQRNIDDQIITLCSTLNRGMFGGQNEERFGRFSITILVINGVTGDACYTAAGDSYLWLKSGNENRHLAPLSPGLGESLQTQFNVAKLELLSGDHLILKEGEKAAQG